MPQSCITRRRSEFGSLNLRLAQIIASEQARSGHFGEAQRTLAGLAARCTGNEHRPAGSLTAASMTPPVPRAVDGIAEAYLALAGTLRAQDAGDFAMLLLRLALDLRPDFTAARLLAADILESEHHLENALQMLASVVQRRSADLGGPLAARGPDRAAGPHRGCDARVAAHRPRLSRQPDPRHARG